MQYDMSELLRLAQSPAGQQLIRYLQRAGGNQLPNIIAQASSGNMEDAKAQLTALVDSEEAKKLLKQLEEQK